MKRSVLAKEYKNWIVDEAARCAVEGYSKIRNPGIFLKKLEEANHG